MLICCILNSRPPSRYYRLSFSLCAFVLFHSGSLTYYLKTYPRFVIRIHTYKLQIQSLELSTCHHCCCSLVSPSFVVLMFSFFLNIGFFCVYLVVFCQQIIFILVHRGISNCVFVCVHV